MEGYLDAIATLRGKGPKRGNQHTEARTIKSLRRKRPKLKT
ncbi:hypothetical protein BLA13014_03777 [Burkholderia aenigmatica]|uniref:Uncharacterized protein n=1 Tax=Burkholderia aenigmatica TaxID=2015348 RepID=A0A6P2MJ57_9BURK|nr:MULTISPECIES: hypothetical protein [Burkholderia]VWB82032.1 hypothetical protein BLA13014_03777 [Burkholderia aenigmatica]